MRIHNMGRFLLLATVLLAGCGYNLVGKSTNLPEDIQKIFVDPLRNMTSRQQVEQLVTEAIMQEFVTRQRFTVVADRRQADAILSGAVTTYMSRPVSLVAGRATEYEIGIWARVEFVRAGTGEVLWHQDRYQFRNNYPVLVDGTGFFDLQNVAVDLAAKDFAETLVIDVLEGF